MNVPGLQTFLRSRAAYICLVAALFVILAGELWVSVARLSQTADEGAHLYSGYQYWRARDYGLNPEHPPLLKYVAAAPLLTLKLQQPHPLLINSKVEEYFGGAQLLYQNDADRLLLRARVAASVFSFALAALVFAAAYEMFGAAAALIALLLCVFEPNLLAHGALVTTDMAAACTIFAAVYALYRYIKKRTPGRLAVVGLALGIAATAKFSSFVLLPVFVVCLAVEAALERWGGLHPDEATIAPHAIFAKRWQGAVGWLGALLIAWVFLWAMYGFAFHARPGSAQLVPSLPAYAAQLPSHAEARFILWMAKWHVFPEAFLYGLVDMQVFGKQMPSFLLGRVHAGTTLLYFPVGFLIKCTLPVLLLLAALPWLLARTHRRFAREVTFLVIPPVIYMAVSLMAPQNIGVRHILPIFPFVVVLAALSAYLMATRSRALAYGAFALLLLHVLSSAHAFPDYLPYGNEAIGGPSRTYLYLTDSNVDWGQPIKEVKAYLTKNNVTDCWYVPFGGSFFSHADYYKISCKALPSEFEKVVGAPVPIIPPDVHGTMLISATEASGLFAGPTELNPYAALLHRRPDAMIGNSVLVFHGDMHLPLAAAEGHASAARMLLQQGKAQEALKEAQTAAGLAPGSPEVQTILGAALLKNGHPEEAHQAFQTARTEAHQLDPDNWLRIDEVIASIHP